MLLAFLCLPATAFGQVNAKTAATMMQQAAKAYEAGDFVKAAEWYGKAWRLDPLPAYLGRSRGRSTLGAMFEPATEGLGFGAGVPAAGTRGGNWWRGVGAGAFALSLDYGPSASSSDVGFRCAAHRP